MTRGIEHTRGEPHISGSIVEQELLGGIESQYFERFREATYIPYRQAMGMVKELQPFDPTDPEPRFANDLHASVAERLSLEDYAMLRFYTAVSKTHLDVFHGVDGFFELQYGADPQDIVTATIDVTTRSKESWKADILVSAPPEGFDLLDPDDKKRYRACMKEASEKLACILQEKLAQASQRTFIRRNPAA